MSGVQFTTLIRVPFARGDFVDPQQVSCFSPIRRDCLAYQRLLGDLGCCEGSRAVEDDFEVVED
jgi:hypothetical protein